MEEMAKIIQDLKSVLDGLDVSDNTKRTIGIERKVRDLVKMTLTRDDLRLPAEMLVNDIYNSFLAFDGNDTETKRLIIEDTHRSLERLQRMNESGELIKEAAMQLPPPPDYVVKEIEKERQHQQKEKAQLDAELRQRQREKEQKATEKLREELKQSEKIAAAEKAKRAQAKSREPRAVERERPEHRVDSRTRKPKGSPAERQPKPRKSESRKSEPKSARPVENERRGDKPERNDQAQSNARAPEKVGPSQPLAMDHPVTQLSGIGSVLASKFKAKDIVSIRDLLYFLPRDYEDRRKIATLNQLEEGCWCTSLVKVEKVLVKHPPGRKGGIVVVSVSDNTGKSHCKFFGGHVNVIKATFQPGSQVIISGEVERFKDTLEFHHPECEPVKEGQKPEGQIVAVYSETEGLTRRRIRGFVRKALDAYGGVLLEPLPDSIRKRHALLPIGEAIDQVHFPKPDMDIDLLKIQATEAHKRLVFEELFLLCLGVAYRKRQSEQREGIAFSGKDKSIRQLIENLPYQLTPAQNKAMQEIIDDMKKPLPMNRLLQGDVGSGKTIVALIAAVATLTDGYQAALMAPTEVLAEQHYQTIKPLVEPLGFKVALLTGRMPAEESNTTKTGIQDGTIGLTIGTHALIQHTTRFARLGLAIIDEQHRFGVSQRRKLADKGQAPDVLTMTATPIPRTLAMTAYGDMDISRIDEKPAGRKPVKTRVVEAAQKKRAFDQVRKILASGQQGYVVYPLVAPSDTKPLLDATSEADRLATEQFKDFRVGLLHGKMKSAEKESVLRAFADKKIDLLVATTVIEVGIDVPGASVIVVEHAERFGLAQLHQLRGRVGRGKSAAECFLIAYDTESDQATNRLMVLESEQNGLVLAEKDLEIRGQGDLLGTMQHGLPPLRIASLGRDIILLETVIDEVKKLLDQDVNLEKTDDAKVAREVLSQWWEHA